MITAYFHDELGDDLYGYENKHAQLAKCSYADLRNAGFKATKLADDNHRMFWHGFNILSVWLKEWICIDGGYSCTLVIETGIMYHKSQDLLDSRYSTYRNSSDKE